MKKYVPLFEEHANATGWWVGLADCHGIESFLEEPDMTEAEEYEKLSDAGFDDFMELAKKIRKGWSQSVAMMKLRAGANSQRHAIVYRVKLRKSDASEIDSMLANGEYAEALSYLKEVALETQVAKTGGMNVEKSWSLIPNPDLDPYR